MKLSQRLAPWLCAWFASVFLCVAAPANLTILDAARRQQPIDAVIGKIAGKRVVFIGEDHERYDEHLDQLEIIRRLDAEAPGHWVIGVEYVQRKFQPYLDAYIAGTISEREFLVKTEYFDRWGYDYRLYRPIFRYAKEHGIPMVALNAERELTDKVSKMGLEGLPSADRASLPQIEPAGKAYRKRLRKVFQRHPGATTADFDRFVEVQSVWDETMAGRIADYLGAHPDKAKIVLAGAGHIAFGSGIPDRVKRRSPGVETAILLPAEKSNKDVQAADYVLVSSNLSLPPSGRMGVVMNEKDPVIIKDVSPNGAAAEAGIHAGDRILAIDAQPVRSAGDFRLALLDKEPGQRVSLRVERRSAAGTEEINSDLTLRK